MTTQKRHYVFDARVIQDHFPGIGRVALNVLRELPHVLRDDEHVSVLHDPGAKNTRLPFASGSPDPRITFIEHRVPVFGARNLFGALPVRADVAHHLYYVRPSFLSRKREGRSITTIYDAISFVYPQLTPSARARFLIRLFHMLAIRASDHVLTISDASARDLTRVFPALAGKISVTPLAADPCFVPQSDARQAAVRMALGIDDPFALYLASNKPHKNIPKLIEAWARCAARETHTLVIAGHQDPRYVQAQDAARTLGVAERVRFLGPVSDAAAAALHSACDVFVFPSLYEGFGLTPLEAMSCGAPVICAKTSSLPEVTGAAALLIDPADSAAIGAALDRVLGDAALRGAMRERSLRRAAQFSWRHTAAATVEAYRQTHTQ
jgi:glycosyltransferase involved in cell wall biosynthesis